MPYGKLEDLPDPIKNSLPKHGQEIYLAAFNSAYKDKADDASAGAIAWSAVKAKYKKDDKGDWVKLQESAPKDRKSVV